MGQTKKADSGVPGAGFGIPAHLTKPIDEYDLGSIIELTDDEWDRRIKATYDPFLEAATPYRDRNPDKHFAFQAPRVQRVKGTRDMTPVLDKHGNPVMVANMQLYWEPKRQREAKDRLTMSKAKAQAAAPEESYKEVQQRIAKRRKDIGVHLLKDDEIVSGHGATYDSSGNIVESEGAAMIGVRNVVGAG